MAPLLDSTRPSPSSVVHAPRVSALSVCTFGLATFSLVTAAGWWLHNPSIAGVQATVGLLLAALTWVLLRVDGQGRMETSDAAHVTRAFHASEASRRALEVSQAHLISFVEHMPAAVAMFDRDLRYLAVSRRWKDDYKLGDRDLIGLHHYDVFPEINQMPEWRAIHQRCLAGAIERCEEDHFLREDGRHDWIQWEVRPWYDAQGDIGGIMMLTEVITPRKLAAQALAESQQRLQLALDNAQHGLWDWDVTTGRAVLDRRWAQMFGYELEEIADWTLETWEHTIHPDDRPHVRAALQRALASDEALYDVDYRARHKDGSLVWINTRGRVQARDEAGRPLRMMGTLHDISDRKASEERLRSALEEKEVLLREIHHRVKNNLAVISSLFYLQSTATRDQPTIDLLEDGRSRIQSMALVHELLYRSNNLAAIDIADYAVALARDLIRSQTRSARIDLVTRVEPVTLAVDVAIPVGLVLNEMLTNAMKHAFHGRDAGCIELELHRSGERCVMDVADDGVGVGTRDPANADSLGMRVMRALARQLEGELEITPRAQGTRARLTFRP
jgi:PAS domain S-box-containing protein